MKSNLQFDFLADRENNTLTVKREFAASRQLVWDAHTKSELLDQWFAPKPLSTKTKNMDFSEGGHWLYAMIEPNGTEYWGRMDYEKIQPISYYMGWDAFTDNTGAINPNLPRARWDVTFTDHDQHTIVENVVSYKSLSDLEQVVQMGMEEGMMSTLEKLDELLEKLMNK